MTSFDNPYVGPRTFTQPERDRFFGREREARELLALVVANRLVLFYAQSGAGKSSLLNTCLIPDLRHERFVVLPIGRVGGDLPAGFNGVKNIFAFNLMLSLDQSGSDPQQFVNLTLVDFMARLATRDGQYYYYKAEPLTPDPDKTATHTAPPHVLIIDQFEEIITTHLHRWEDRTDFFRQLEEVMSADPQLWVVLTLREDYVAALDPHAPLMRNRMQTRFYMQRMDNEAALKAITMPAAQYGRPFAPGVAETLVDNLRQIRVQGQPEPQLGQFVEPVQLQVVCYQLWENLKERPPGEITLVDLHDLGNVDRALGQFYEQALAKTLQQSQVAEIDLRTWFDEYLITEAGTRGTVYQGLEDTAGLPNGAVKLLADQFLLRAEIRSGGTWYELVHDRFIEPIQQANQNWRERQPLLQIAQSWLNSGRSDSQLLEGQPLQEALTSPWQGLGPVVAEFLAASQAAQEAKEEALEAEREVQRQRELETARQLAAEAEARRQVEEARAREQAEAATKLRQRAVMLTVVGLVATLLALVAGLFGYQARQKEQEAIKNAAQAAAESTRAQASALEAIAASELSKANEAAAVAERATAIQAASIAATKQQATVLAAETMALAAQATAEILATTVAEARATWAANLEAQLSAAPTLPVPTHTATRVVSSLPSPESSLTPPVTSESLLPTLDLTATAVALQMVQVELDQVKATQTAAAEIPPTPSATSTPTPTPVPTSTPIATTPIRLIYVQRNSQNDDWQHGLAIISANGTILQYLVLYAAAPAWSPDGRRVAFLAEEGIQNLGGVFQQGGGIWTIDAQGQNPRRLRPATGVENMTWSPDGTKLAYEVESRGIADQILLIDAETGREIARFFGEQPTWSPDSQTLVIRECNTAACGLWWVNLAGEKLKQLTFVGTDSFPAWSPDDQYLAFTSRGRDGNWEIYRLDLKEGRVLRLTDRPGTDTTPVFSSDSQEIYFCTDAFGGWRVMAIKVDGSGERLVKEGIGFLESWGLARPAVH